MVIRERTTQTIAQVVAEGRNSRHSEGIFLVGQFIVIISQFTDSPTFTVCQDGWINGIKGFPNGIHGFYIVDCHQIEAESVNMIFFSPVTN